jgi:hypothetical protein
MNPGIRRPNSRNDEMSSHHRSVCVPNGLHRQSKCEDCWKLDCGNGSDVREWIHAKHADVALRPLR